MTLTKYNKKRKFTDTPEPEGKKAKKVQHRFVVQRHHASRLHYDFRLELDGVLKSWAIPKGPSLNPKDKRLAMMVEDHPVDYIWFKGEIPEGNYGAGMVIIWDKGNFIPVNEKSEPITEKQALAAIKKGQLKFSLKGKKLKGEFALVKLKNDQKSGDPWLLVKHRDRYAVDEVYDSEEFVSEKDKKAGGKKKAPPPPRKRVNIRFPKSSQKLASYHKPMLATLTDAAFDDDEWIFEIKWDGYRAVAETDHGKVKYYSRNGLSFLEKFEAITQSLKKIAHKAVLDGEVVLLNDKGLPDFQKLQQYEDNYHLPLVYYVFDLLKLDGRDLHHLPLLQRKELLKTLIEQIDDPVIRFSDHITGTGKVFFDMAAKKNLEGIIAKKADSEYTEGYRSKQWLKIKYQQNMEAIIAGYTAPRGSRKHFGALMLAQYKDDELVYIGHTGTGFNQQTLKELWEKMQPLVRKTSPFNEKVKTNMPATWIKPQLVCQVTFTEMTADGKLRHPVFMGLREDKNFTEVKQENETPVKKNTVTAKKKATKKTAKKTVAKKKPADKPVPKKNEKKNATIKSGKSNKPSPGLVSPKDEGDKEVKVARRDLLLTNLDKIYYPGESITKAEILHYYENIAPYILPYLKNRPLSLLRHPNGIEEKGFFQKNVGGQAPEWVKKIDIHSDSGNKIIHYVMCNDLPSLLFIANLGCIEMNPWNSTAKKIEHPTWMVIDIDPSDKNTFDEVIEAAQVTHDVLNKAGAANFCKTSGATGLHVYVPMGNRYTYQQVKEFGELIAMMVHEQLPKTTSIERSLKKRGHKIYMDFLQNRRGQTLATAYSARPKPGATVSTPLQWDEVKPGLHPSHFHIHNIMERLEKKGDLFQQVLGKGINLKKCLENLGG